jgi:hypothetical protein
VGTRRYVLFKSKLEKEKKRRRQYKKAKKKKRRKKDKNRKVGRLSWAIVFNRKATRGGWSGGNH